MMRVVDVMSMVMVVVAVVPSVAGSDSVMMPSYSWEDCGSGQSQMLSITHLELTSPMNIPGQLTIRRLVAKLNGPLPTATVIKFELKSNTSFGPQYLRTIPCIEEQGGSCAYRVCDMVQLTPQASSIRRQILTALRSSGLASQCPVTPVNIDISDVTIDIPSMLHTRLDLLINTNNYFLTATLQSGNDTLGCLQVNMPVYKPCQGWLCTKGIDEVISVMHSSNN